MSPDNLPANCQECRHLTQVHKGASVRGYKCKKLNKMFERHEYQYRGRPRFCPLEEYQP